jgi:hypothetical protein
VTNTTYFIIEHPSRGVLQEEPNRDTGRPAFSWVGSRSNESNARYFQLRRAIQDLMELDLPEGCVIRSSVHHPRYGGWRVVWPKDQAAV